MNIFINTNYVDDLGNRGKLEKRFPLIYFWLKDSYYQNYPDQFEKTDWRYSDDPREMKDNPQLQQQLRDCPPDIVGLSLYMWNTDTLLRNALWIKENVNPDVIIVAAGPNADSRQQWMEENVYVDYVVNGPAAETFNRIINCTLEGKHSRDVLGVNYWDGTKVVRNAPVPRKEDQLVLNYVNNFRDEVVAMLDDYTARFDNVIVLTMLIQGCPYSCSFCEQGTSLWTKINQRNLQYVFDEIDLISQYDGIIYEFADANFGIVPQYEEIIDYVIANSDGKVRFKKPPFAKNNVEHTFHLIKKMRDSGIYHSPHDGQISLQDPNPEILKLNGRPVSKEYEKIKAFREYTGSHEHKTAQVEVILGMPYQTFDTLWNSLSDLVEQDLLSHFLPYFYLIFPNTVLTSHDSEIDITYRRTSVRGELSWVQGFVDRGDINTAQMGYVHLTSTPTLSTKELVSVHYYWTLVCHLYGFLGWLKTPLLYLKNHHGVSKRQFIEAYAKQFHPDVWHKLPDSIHKDLEYTARWFEGTDELFMRRSECDRYWLSPKRSSLYRFHASYDDFEIIFRRAFDELGIQDSRLNELFAWQGAKAMRWEPSIKHTNSIISYNYDDIAQATGESFWKSAFSFEYKDLDIYDKLERMQDINWIPETIVEQCDLHDQKELQIPGKYLHGRMDSIT